MRLLLVALLFFGSAFAQDETDNDSISSSLGALKFRGIGPALSSGRIVDLAVDPDDTSRWFVAVASGGVWKTENAGTTFEPVFDGESSYSIGCVTIDPNNRHTIWVGSGENNSQRSVSWGDGVYRSLDGGKSWKNTGLGESEHIGRIAVDPRDSNVVWVAAQGPLWRDGGDRGLYKTTDGGETWNKVLEISESTGINEVHLDPDDPDVAYASAYQRRRHVWTLINGGPESGLHKTTDGGQTWRKIESGLPKVDKGKIGLAISPADPDVIYAIVEAQRGKGGTFRSVDRGESWTKQSSKVSNSPQYYNELVCDPHDVDTVYCLDTWTSVSRDGGKTWTNVGNKHRHVDDHALWIDPQNTRHLIIGGDGGLYETYDGGADWDFFENLPVTQFYRVSADQAEPFYNVYGGTQDNNSMGGPSRTTSLAGITNDDWFVTVGGDGYEAQVDPTNPDIVYTQWQYGGLVRHDRKSGELTDIKPREAPGETPIVWNWDSPLLLSSHSPTRLYFAGDRLFRSDDRGDSWQTLTQVFTRGIDRDKLLVMGRVQEVDAVAKNASTSIYGNLVSLAESPLDENVIWVGSDDGLVHMTNNLTSWGRIETFPGVPEQTYVSRLEASRHEVGRVYAAFSNHKNGDFKPYLLVSDDFGTTWRSIASNLPPSDVVWSIAEDHENENLLFVGTEYGLYVSLDRGSKWTRMKGGLPTIAVRDIEIQRRENDLILGTFGRGFYVLDDYTPLRALSEDLLAAPAHLFGVRKAPLYIQRSRLGLNTGLGSQGSTYFAAPNPPYGAIITYHLRDGLKTRKELREEAQKKARESGETHPFPTDEQMREEGLENEPVVFVTIKDADGNVVRRVDAVRKEGMHRIAWDLRYPKATKIELGDGGPGAPWSMPAAGPLVLAGRFTATLEQEVAGVVTQLAGPVEFEVEALNLATLPAVDRAEVLAFQKDVVELRRAVRATTRVLGELQTRVDHLRVAVRRGGAVDQGLLRRVAELDRSLADLRIKLSGDSSLSGRNKPAPMSISSRIEKVAGSQLYTSSAPTKTEREAWSYAADAFAPVLGRVRVIATSELPGIERALEVAGVGDTPGRLPEWRRR